jgi:hypothetical protein
MEHKDVLSYYTSCEDRFPSKKEEIKWESFGLHRPAWLPLLCNANENSGFSDDVRRSVSLKHFSFGSSKCTFFSCHSFTTFSIDMGISFHGSNQYLSHPVLTK